MPGNLTYQITTTVWLLALFQLLNLFFLKLENSSENLNILYSYFCINSREVVFLCNGYFYVISMKGAFQLWLLFPLFCCNNFISWFLNLPFIKTSGFLPFIFDHPSILQFFVNTAAIWSLKHKKDHIIPLLKPQSLPLRGIASPYYFQ